MTSYVVNDSATVPRCSRIRLRYAGKCGICATVLAVGSSAYYDRDARKAYCDEHVPRLAGSDMAVPAQKGRKMETSPATPLPLAPTLAADRNAATAATSKNEHRDAALPASIKVKYPGSCAACTRPLPRGVDAFYIRGAKAMVCVECTRLEVSLGLATNAAGAGAERMAEAASRRHAQRLLAAYPILGEQLLENAKPPASVQAWIRGADGERIVGKALDELVHDGRIEVLHDRLIPGTRSNIDHIVIGPRRITVIDAKHYRGAIIRTKKVDATRTLFVDDKEASHLVDGVRAQCAKVRAELGTYYDEVVEGTLAFVGANHGSLGGTFGSRGIACMNVKEAVGRAAFSGWVPGNPKLNFDAEQRAQIRDRIAATFPAYRR